MDAVDEGDSGGSLNRECKLPLEPLDRGSVGDSARSASPADLVRRSSAIFLRRSSGGGSGGFVVILVASLRALRVAAFRFLGQARSLGLWRARRLSEVGWWYFVVELPRQRPRW